MKILVQMYERPRRRRVALNTKWNFPLVVIGVSLVLAPNSRADLTGLTPTPPGSTVGAGLTSDPAGTLLADLVAPYSFTTTAGTTSGTIQSAVYMESGGTLDFYYQVANNAASVTSIARETDVSFTGFTTSTGYRTDGATLTGTSFVDGTVPPIFADRNGTGAVVGFLFDLSDATKVSPGDTSTVLIISTNATRFTAGNASVIDGGSATVAAFEPSAVPEPRSAALLVAVLMLAGVAGKRHFRRTQ